jgi:class 3 adenylate cyclase
LELTADLAGGLDRAIDACAAALSGQSGERGVPSDRVARVRALVESPASLRGSIATRRSRLAALGRLLVRRNTPALLGQALALSHRLNDLERSDGVETTCSTLLRGLARLGLGDEESGALDVLRASGTRRLSREDRALASWGLVSIALSTRELVTGHDAALRWRELARGARLESECARATYAVDLLAWLLGRGPEPAGPPPLAPFLGHAIEHDGSLWPLHSPAPLGVVCRARREWTGPGATPLPEEQLVAAADLFAAWESADVALDLERLLRAGAPERWMHLRAGRLLGAEAWRVSASVEASALAPARVEDVVVWTCDVRGYSTLSESVAPEVLFAVLAPVFKAFHEELESAGGLILEFIGDAILVVFNAFPGQRAEVARILSQTGRALDRVLARARLAAAERKPNVRVGVGVARGPAAAGMLGSLRRCHLSTLGNTVNTAARIEGISKELPGLAAVDASTFGGSDPAVWREPELVTYTLRDCGRHRMKNMATPAHLYALAPLVRHGVDFVPMGFVGASEPGIVYLDVGNRPGRGVFDNHAASDAAASTIELVLEGADRLLRHARGIDPLELLFRMHEEPDLDCVASYVAAVEVLERARVGPGAGPEVRRALARRRRSLERLGRYVGRVDQGAVPDPARIGDSVQGIFLAHLRRCDEAARARGRRGLSNRERLAAGVRVVDAALFLADRIGPRADFASIFAAEPTWFGAERRLLADDRAVYLRDRAKGEWFEARVAGAKGPVPAIWLEDPRSILFKLWARTDPDARGGRGFGLMVVDRSVRTASFRANRFVLSVDPDSGTHLFGLGQALEAAEKARRIELGLPRPVEPRRLPSDNANPWYFGQGHEYTIVDSPSIRDGVAGTGTVLTAREVRAILDAWRPSR